MTETAGKSALIQGFMTHRMTDGDVMALATGREKPTGVVMDAVQRSRKAAPGALQHVVIYGPRGFGKSFMTRLVQIETTRLSTDDRPVRFVLLPEEQHNLTRNPHALLDYIASKLADLRTGQDRSWEDSMFRWPDPTREAALWEQAVQTLEDELGRSFGGAPGLAVVVIENFDMLLATLFKENTAEERLRAWLDRPGNRVMLIATATGTVDLNYERPLFQAFQPIRLEPWSQDDCIAYFNKHRQLDGKPALDPAMEAKARAIADFIGGNPRLARLLAEVLETQEALTVAQTMNALADKLADYYRRRIDDLPPLAQGLLDALIRGGEPASQTGLAERVGAGGQSTIARVMQDLQRGDIVRGLEAPDGRETLYRVTDRVFVHFYRLRQGNRTAQATPLATILDFLRAFYSRDEQRAQAARHLDAGRAAEARVFADLALEDDSRSARHNDYRSGFVGRLEWLEGLEPGVLPDSPTEIARLADEHPELLSERFARPAVDAGPLAAAAGVMASAQARVRLGLPEVADALLAESTTLAAPAGQVILRLEQLLLRDREFGDRPGAIEIGSYLPGQLDPTVPIALRMVALQIAAWSLGALGRHEEAAATARDAAALAAEAGAAREHAVALRNAAWSLSELGRHEEAEATAREAAALAAEAGATRQRVVALGQAAWSLVQLGRHEEAVATAHEAAALAAEAGDTKERAEALWQAAWSLGELGRHGEAFTVAVENFNSNVRERDDFNADLSACVALRAACRVAEPDAVDLFRRWMVRDADRDDPHSVRGINSWKRWVDELFGAVVLTRSWDDLDALLLDQHARFSERPLAFEGSPVGRAIARVGADEGRAAGFEAATEILKRIIVLFGEPLDGAAAPSWITGLVSSFAVHCRNPGLISDVAHFLETLGPPDGEPAALLRALVVVDTAERPERFLARMDPDIALWIRRVRDLPEPRPKPRKRKGSR